MPLLLHAQGIQENVTASSGQSSVNEGYHIEWTIGEILTSTFEFGPLKLSQGFHQGVYDFTVELPSVETTNPLLLDATTARIGGVVVTSGGAIVIDRGVFWGDEANPEVSGSKVSLGSGTGEFYCILENLIQGHTYYFVAYAENSEGIAYGQELSFCMQVLPTVNTQPVDGVTDLTATVGGEVVCDGGSEVIERGIYWGLSPEPQSNGFQVTLGSGIGTFNYELSGLDPLTTYYVVAYAINTIGTAFGSEISFTTIGLPDVVTSEVAGITDNSALLGGIVIADGGDVVTERGVFYGIDAEPELYGVKLTIGSGLGEFSEVVANLEPGTIYYVKAFATNGIGTAIGVLMTFETLPEDIVPIHREIDGLVMIPGQDTCFSATETITVAGNGQTVEVLSGANLHLIAGKSITLKNGFRVYSGGAFLARIDTEGNYCENARSLLAADSSADEDETNTFDRIGLNKPLFRAYPNPTSGILSVELFEATKETAELQVFSLMGEVVFLAQIDTQRSYQVDLSGLARGMYIIRITAGNASAVERIIRK